MKTTTLLAIILLSLIIVLSGCSNPEGVTKAPRRAAARQATRTAPSGRESETNESASATDAATASATRTTDVPLAAPAPATASTDGASSASDVKEFTLTASDWEWDPNIITVRKGDHVRLRVTALDVPHGFAIPKLGVDEYLPPGEEEVIDFTPTMNGTFTFYCSVSCGSGHSHMRGKLVVEE